MQLSELIEFLQELLEEHGDLECASYTKHSLSDLKEPHVGTDDSGEDKIFLGPVDWG